MSLLLKKNGILEHTDWHYDEEADKGEYRSRDLTEDADLLLFMHNNCELDEGVTLDDVFQLLAKHETLFNLLMPNCYVKEYLAAREEEKTKDTDIEYLELYTHLETDNREYDPAMPKNLNGLFLPQFHGIGKVLEEDGEEGFYKKGDRINWSLSFSPVANLLHLPIKIADHVTVSNALDWKEEAHVIKATPQYTVFQILYGILWEISWHGSPESTKKVGDEVMAAAEEVTKHPERLVSFDPENT